MPHRALRSRRKHACLTQGDIAFLFGYREYSNVSHMERGRRSPNLEHRVYLHFLFDLPVDGILAQEKTEFCERLTRYIGKLKHHSHTPFAKERIAYLEQVLSRLTTPSP